MKLQKLAFYSQAQHLAQYESSLFPEDCEAWRGGTVAPELYALHRGMFLIRPGELPSGDSSALTDAERGLIDSVCSVLGSLTGAELSERTHLESPWLDAREGLAPSDPSNARAPLAHARGEHEGVTSVCRSRVDYYEALVRRVSRSSPAGELLRIRFSPCPADHPSVHTGTRAMGHR